MKVIEIRRHSKSGQDKGLSEKGRRIAREAWKTLSPPYELYVSSPKRRACETMEAFGFQDYAEDGRFSTIRSPVMRKLEAELRAQGRAYLKEAQVLMEQTALPPGDQTLGDLRKH